MSILEKWEHFFKPEVRNSGRVFFAQGKVSSSQLSDTEIQAFIKASSGSKVSLKSTSVSSSLVSAGCSCPSSKKGQLCKHIWAALLQAEKKHPDFFDGKKELQKNSVAQELPGLAKQTFAKTFTKVEKKPLSQSQLESQAAFKQKQNNYRKEQYQKQKQRLKDRKQSKKTASRTQAPKFPEDVSLALNYFSQNGFSLEDSLTAEAIRQAKKKLSQVFHPDKGGSHEEILELNENCTVLLDFVGS